MPLEGLCKLKKFSDFIGPRKRGIPARIKLCVRDMCKKLYMLTFIAKKAFR
jgi:hypothetical protein